jgi:hypothetical protein
VSGAHTNPQSRPPTSKASGMVKTRRVKLRNELKSRRSHHSANMARERGDPGRKEDPPLSMISGLFAWGSDVFQRLSLKKLCVRLLWTKGWPVRGLGLNRLNGHENEDG